MISFYRMPPIIELQRLAPSQGLWVIAEHLHPSGSIYDRIAGPMLEGHDAARPAVVAGSGSLCLAFARAAAQRGVSLVAVCPKRTLAEHLLLLRQHDLTLHTSEGGLYQTHELARTLGDGALVYSPAQTGDAAAHFAKSVGADLKAVKARIDRVVLPLGAAALAEGLALALKDDEIRIEGTCAPAESEQDDVASLSEVAFLSLANKIEVSDADAHRARSALAQKEGLLVGLGSAAAVAWALERPARTLVVLTEAGDRYFSRDRVSA